jgi:hypothetical protein
MKARLLVAAMAVAVLVGRELSVDPWRDWQPPKVELPVPNAFDDYQLAAQLVRDPWNGELPWPDPLRDAAARRRVLAENAEALRALRAGFAHPCVEPRAHAADFGDSFHTRCSTLARILGWQAVEHAAQGRYAAALASGLDAEQLGFDLARRAALGGLATGRSARAAGRDEKAVQPRIDPLTASEARAAAARLAALLASEQSLTQSLTDDRDCNLQWFAAQNVTNHRRITNNLAENCRWRAARSLTEWVGPGPWVAAYRRYMDAVVAWSALPWNAAPPPREDLFFAGNPQYGDGARTVSFAYARADAEDHMFLAALALQAWRAEHGAYPDTLDALVPDILKEVPADPFGRGALRYRRDGERYVLYGVGPEGRDHGGRPAAEGVIDGDWRPARDLRSRGDFVWRCPQGAPTRAAP